MSHRSDLKTTYCATAEAHELSRPTVDLSVVKDGRPARFVWRGERWVVTVATPAELDFLPTHGSVVTAWDLRAQTEASDDVGRLLVRRADGGWVIDNASFG